MSKKKNLLILGAYGQENIGDEALLKSVLNNISQENYKDIYVNSMSPTKTALDFQVKSFQTGFIHTILPFLKSDIIIYGGGTILVELRMTPYIKSLPLIRSFLINFFANLLGKKVIFLGIGAENVNSLISKWLMKKSIHYCTKCFVRDQNSFEILSKSTNDKNKIVLTADLVFALPPSSKNNKKNRAKPKILILPLYRIINFSTNYEQYINSIKDFVIKANQNDIEVEFYPMRVHKIDKNNDRFVLESLEKDLGKVSKFNYDTYSISEFMDYISSFDLIMSSRFHGLVFGMIQNIPVISLSEFDKNTSLMEYFGLEQYSLKSDILDGNLLFNLSSSLLSNPMNNEVKKNILKKFYKISKLSKENFKYIKSM